MKAKKKTCSSCGREDYIWSKGMCKQCAVRASNKTLRGTFSPKGYKSATKEKKAFKTRAKMAPRKRKDTVTDKFLKEHFGFKSQVALFDFLWRSRPMRCPISDKDLKPFEHSRHERSTCCAHLLPKGRWVLYKLNPDNVWLIHPSVHMILDQGTQADRDKYPDWNWEMWDERVEELKDEYISFKEKYM